MLAAAGAPAAVLGFSSGAALVLEAAAAGVPMAALALYDLPPEQPPEHVAALAALIDAGRRGDAVEYFQRRLVGLPEDVVQGLRRAPFRPALEAVAHTLVTDAALVSAGRRPADLLARVGVRTLAIVAEGGFPGMREAAEAVARAVPDGQATVLAGGTHDLDARLAPVLTAFFGR
ncbi:MAG: hypothetical protein R3F59_16545 [Myxococcota bacterium]